MGQDQEEAASENGTLISLLPLIVLDELEHKVDVQPLLQLHFVLLLDLADDTDKVQESVLHLHCLRPDLTIEILVQNLFLDERITGWVELLE